MDLKSVADEGLARPRDTRWFGSGYDANVPKPAVKRTRFPIKSPSTLDATTREGSTAENGASPERLVTHQVQHGRLPSPVRPSVIPHGNPAVWTSKNADP